MKKLSLILTLLLISMYFSFAQYIISEVKENTFIHSISSTATSTITDFDGTYSFNIPNGDHILVFGYTGFFIKEIKLGAFNVLDVILQEGLALTEMVVTAQGIRKEKRALEYSVSTVKGQQAGAKTSIGCHPTFEGQGC